MDQNKDMELLLWDYLDGRLSAAEKTRVDDLLSNDPHWAKALFEMREMNAMISATEFEQPSMRFSKNIMDEITKYKIAPAAKSYVNKKVVFGIAGFFLVMIAGFLIYLFTQIDFSAGSTSTTSIELPKMEIDWKKWINSTYVQMFLMADIVFGLMLLDRYLARKRKANRENQGLV